MKDSTIEQLGLVLDRIRHAAVKPGLAPAERLDIILGELAIAAEAELLREERIPSGEQRVLLVTFAFAGEQPPEGIAGLIEIYRNSSIPELGSVVIAPDSLELALIDETTMASAGWVRSDDRRSKYTRGGVPPVYQSDPTAETIPGPTFECFNGHEWQAITGARCPVCSKPPKEP